MDTTTAKDRLRAKLKSKLKASSTSQSTSVPTTTGTPIVGNVDVDVDKYTISFVGVDNTVDTSKVKFTVFDDITEYPHNWTGLTRICDTCAKNEGGEWPRNKQAPPDYQPCTHCAKTRPLSQVKDWNWKCHLD